MEDCLFCMIAEGKILQEAVRGRAGGGVLRHQPAGQGALSGGAQKHIVSAAALTEEDGALLGHIFAVIAKLAAEQGLNNGYRVISNVGEDAGQTVKHLHFHVLGGEKLPV